MSTQSGFHPSRGTAPDIELVVAGSAVTSVTFTVDGNSDGGYRIWGAISNPGAAGYYVIQPNGANTNCTSSETGTASTSLLAFIPLCYADSTSAFGAGTLTSKTGLHRFYNGHYNDPVAGAAVASIFGIAGIWNDTTTNLTSIKITADIAGGIGVGSRFAIWKQRSVL